MAIRPQFVGDLLWDRQEMRERGVPGVSIALFSVQEIFNGLSQHLPLRSPVTETLKPVLSPSLAAERAAEIGWLAWRLSGAALFGGYLVANVAVFVLGAVLLLGALASLVVVAIAGEEPLTVAQTRLLNGILGGVFVNLFIVVCIGALVSLLIGVAALAGWTALADFAVTALVFLTLLAVCVISASGWVAEEWFPKRLIANE
ncbi:MAG: hypothetical protein OER88_05080 [Planctomycetota bacterium]|nr:hypothetical protein [Planctomycetota bacterium]